MMTQLKHVFLWCAVLLSLTENFGACGEKDKEPSAINLREARAIIEPDSHDHPNRLSPSLLVRNPDDFDEVFVNGKDSVLDDIEKKASSFVRIGKLYPMNRFIRIGRLSDVSNADDLTDLDKIEDYKRASQFVRIGKGPSSFVRIGKSEVDDQQNEVEKKASRFVRIGKPFQSLSDQKDTFTSRMKRSAQLSRIVRAPSSFVRIGKAPSRFVRIGKAPSNFVRIGKAPSNFVRIGKAPSSFVRIGKAPSSFVRIGKAPSRFVRIGKSPSSFVRIGKSDFDFVNKNLDTDYIDTPDYSEKRNSRFLRIGKGDLSNDVIENNDSFMDDSENVLDEEKRMSSFVRIGKSELDEENSDIKRASSFLRIGKSDSSNNAISEIHKRGSIFVPFGKTPQSVNINSPPSPAEPSSTSSESVQDGNLVNSKDSIKVATRGSAFVRIGKIPSSAFVRIGKNTDLVIDQADYNRGTRGNQSSFVRIGK